jgi:hypothetical protein
MAARPVKEVLSADYVYVRRGPLGGPFSTPYTGPFKVIDKREKVFDIQMGPRVESVSIDRLKPHRGDGHVEQATPPVRGRPPGTG